MVQIIKNLLPVEVAEILSKNIYGTKEEWWSHVYRYGNNQPVYFKNSLYDIYRRKEAEREVVSSLIGGTFTYRFKRSTTHVPTCTCYECNFKENYLLQPIFKDILTEHAGIKNPVLYESFVSAYSSGDFLSLHTDENRGVAFIINLTQGWKPEYGGMLNVLEDDGNFKTIFPEFNSLVLLPLKNNGIPHFVSEVTDKAPFSRIAITGWFNEG